MAAIHSEKIYNILLFGAGKRLHSLFALDYFRNYHIVAILDNDPRKYGSCEIQRSIDVVSPDQIHEYDGQYDAILITIAYRDREKFLAIMHQLLCLNVPHEKIYFCVDPVPIAIPKVVRGGAGQSNGRVFFDVSGITYEDRGTGIQRASKNLYLNLRNSLSERLVPTQYFDGYITSYVFDRRIMEAPMDNIEYAIKFNSADKLLLPDLMLNLGEELAVVRAAQQAHTLIFSIMHDIFALTHSDMCTEGYIKHFKRYFEEIVPYVDCFMCVSKTVADSVVQFFEENKIPRSKPLTLYYFHHGVDFHSNIGTPREEIYDFVSRNLTFLMVGTTERRKNPLIALQALKKLILARADTAAQLLILGHDDNYQPFKNMYYNDEIIRDRVLWVKDADDGELQWAYKNAAAFLFPSMLEGFGIPLIEAAHFGLPILCSDIPIFHEIAGDSVTYFAVNDADAMAHAMLEFMEGKPHPDSKTMRICTWKDSADRVLQILNGEIAPYKVIR